MQQSPRGETHWWLSCAHLTQYQALLLDKDRLTFNESLAINPATLLLDGDPEVPVHDCLEMLYVTSGP